MATLLNHPTWMSPAPPSDVPLFPPGGGAGGSGSGGDDPGPTGPGVDPGGGGCGPDDEGTGPGGPPDPVPGITEEVIIVDGSGAGPGTNIAAQYSRRLIKRIAKMLNNIQYT